MGLAISKLAISYFNDTSSVTDPLLNISNTPSVTDTFNTELQKLKILIENNLISSKDIGGACKAINENNLRKRTLLCRVPIPNYTYPNDPVWFGPIASVDLYFKHYYHDKSGLRDLNTYVCYKLNKNYNFIRFTNKQNQINQTLIRQMYTCLELFWENSAMLSSDKRNVIVKTHSGYYTYNINVLRETFGYSSNRRNSRYWNDKLIITDLIKLVELMNFQNIDPILGYYWDDKEFTEEFTIVGKSLCDILKLPIIAKKTSEETWEQVGSGINLTPTNELLQIEPTINNKANAFINNTLINKEVSNKLNIPGIINSNEFIELIKKFFYYQYDNAFSKNPNINNNRIKQIEIKQKAIGLITDKNFSYYINNFLDCYIPSSVKNKGGGKKSKRSKRVKRTKKIKKTKRGKTKRGKITI